MLHAEGQVERETNGREVLVNRWPGEEDKTGVLKRKVEGGKNNNKTGVAKKSETREGKGGVGIDGLRDDEKL
ncbi:hypothetical protein GOBAR_DD26576 [Gossypium barbadense]|nr:hypothetical protein GOBAR_DD26576 [Gossypium barbadense]